MLLLTVVPTALLGVLVWVIIFLIVAGLIFWAMRALSAAFGIPAPVQTVLTVLLVVICVVALLAYLVENLGLMKP
jgi:hypothetical protein